MTDVEITEISRQVQKNCDISDAQHAGALSMCSFLLLIRNFLKWENGSEPWEEGESSVVTEWIGEKEDLWSEMTETPYGAISIKGSERDAFALEEINSVLAEDGLLYGAGYAGGMKPTFFLGRLEKRERVNGISVYTLGHELARDMLGAPALRQHHRIYLRRECARFFVWDRLFEKVTAKKPAALFALNEFGVHDLEGMRRHLDVVVEQQVRLMLHHEIGECGQEDHDEVFKELLAAYPLTPIERFVRALRDVLADTHPQGTLGYLVESRNSGALGLYVSFIDGFARSLFPEIARAFLDFLSNRDWSVVAETRVKARAKLENMARDLSDFASKRSELGDESVGKAIRETMIDPLLAGKH